MGDNLDVKIDLVRDITDTIITIKEKMISPRGLSVYEIQMRLLQIEC